MHRSYTVSCYNHWLKSCEFSKRPSEELKEEEEEKRTSKYTNKHTTSIHLTLLTYLLSLSIPRLLKNLRQINQLKHDLPVTPTHSINFGSSLSSRLSHWFSSRSLLNILSLGQTFQLHYNITKVEKILKGSLDLITSPSPYSKIQIMGRTFYLRHKDKTLLAIVNRLFVFKGLLITYSNVLPLYLSCQ